MRELAGKTAVVTGAASGIGRALAMACAHEGMRVVLADLDPGGNRDTEAAIRALGGDPLSVFVDVAVASEVERLAAESFSKFGRVDLLINNAGVMVAGPVWETPIEDWSWLLGVNLMGVIHGLRSFVPRMIAQGGEAWIVNIASLAGLVSAPGMGGYCVTKHGVVALSECLQQDLRLVRAPIGVSVVCPGFVATRLAEASRHRPHEAAAATPVQIAITRRVERLLESSTITADEVAAATIEAVKEQRFYVLTHPGTEQAVQQRASAIQQRRAPPMVRLA